MAHKETLCISQTLRYSPFAVFFEEKLNGSYERLATGVIKKLFVSLSRGLNPDHSECLLSSVLARIEGSVSKGSRGGHDLLVLKGFFGIIIIRYKN